MKMTVAKPIFTSVLGGVFADFAKYAYPLRNLLYERVWASRHDWRVLGRERRPDGTYRDVRKHTEKPRREWIALPVPDAGVPREVAERTRWNVELRLPAPRLAMLAEGQRRLRELEELPALVDEYLEDLPYLMDRMPVIREYETIGAERTPENPLGIYTLTPERIRHLSEEEVAARSARFRELYAMLGLRAAIHADSTLEIAVGAANTKGIMPCEGSGSPSTTSTPT
jgi:hypothetical protein